MTILQTIRRRLLTPPISQTHLDVRGFHVKSAETRERLETVGRSFLEGYGHAAAARRPRDAEMQLERVPANYRGFAFEGAAMALAVRDGLPFGGSQHVERFLQGRADRHIYMVYVGVGWAMARIPRFRWSALYAPDPLLRWLVLDGYGFHQAYFKTRQYVYEHYQEDRFPWPGDAPGSCVKQVIDQGIGRATWFVGGADPDLVVQIFDTFPSHRQPDLYSGAALAASYAGGATREELERFWELAGPYQPQVAQGAAFASAARVRADLVMPHNELAAKVFCGMTPAEAAAVTDEALVDLLLDGPVPAYAVWRQRISETLASRGRCGQ